MQYQLDLALGLGPHAAALRAHTDVPWATGSGQSMPEDFCLGGSWAGPSIISAIPSYHQDPISTIMNRTYLRELHRLKECHLGAARSYKLDLNLH